MRRHRLSWQGAVDRIADARCRPSPGDLATRRHGDPGGLDVSAGTPNDLDGSRGRRGRWPDLRGRDRARAWSPAPAFQRGREMSPDDLIALNDEIAAMA